MIIGGRALEADIAAGDRRRFATMPYHFCTRA